jgi:putative ATP-binding cassette transporter
VDLLILLAKRSKWTVVAATLTGLFCGLAAAGLIAVINEQLTSIANNSSVNVWLFVGLVVAVVITRTLADISLLHLGQSAISDLRLHLSSKLIDTPYATLQRLGKHRLLAILTDDSQVISQAVELVPVLMVNLSIVVACMLYLGWLSLPMLGLFLVVLLLGVVAFRWPQAKAVESLSISREMKDELFSQYRLLTEGTKELQLSTPRRERFFNRQLVPTSLRYKNEFVKGMSIFALVLNWGNGMFYVVIGAVLFIAPLYLEVEVALITGYILTILYMITPLSEIMNALPMLGRASVALAKIRTLQGQLSVQDSQDAQSLQKESVIYDEIKQLECRDVYHTYYREREDRHFQLGPVNLVVKAGEVIFITGGNGSGKTTLAMLLSGLYQPEKGELLLNGKLSSSVHSDHYRQHFSAIFTDFCLFEDLFDKDTSALIEQAQEYLVQLQLDHKVQIKDGQLSTIDLSTGQRKRLALLAAYLDDRPCYLFDEWAADQDPIFKDFFYRRILADLQRRNKLVLVISHDDSYFSLADRCFKVADGQVNEMSREQLTEPVIARCV